MGLDNFFVVSGFTHLSKCTPHSPEKTQPVLLTGGKDSRNSGSTQGPWGQEKQYGETGFPDSRPPSKLFSGRRKGQRLQQPPPFSFHRVEPSVKTVHLHKGSGEILLLSLRISSDRISQDLTARDALAG